MPPTVSTSAPLIDAAHAAFLQGAVSIIVSSCGPGLRPQLMRAVGCRVAPDLREVTVLINRVQAAQVLADIDTNGRIAVVFSEPSSHRTLQLKAGDAHVVPVGTDDLMLMERYRTLMTAEIAGIGLGGSLVDAMLRCSFTEAAALCFIPNAAFQQTPGPQAGAPLAAGGGAGLEDPTCR
jgi:hypothetical protein